MIKISLGYIKNLTSGAPSLIPYWFTRDNKIYLNKENKEIEVDETKLDKHTLIEIYNGVVYGSLMIDNMDLLNDALGVKVEPDVQESVTSKDPVKSIDELKEEKEKKKADELTQKAMELIELNVAKMKDAIGSTTLTDDGELKDGIADIKLLEKMKDLEMAKEEPRKTVFKMIDDRIEAINASNGVMYSEEEETVELKPEDFKE